MLRKTLLQSRSNIGFNTKRTVVSLSKKQFTGQKLLKNTGAFYKRSYSSHQGTKLESTVLNYSVEDVLSIGLSVLAVKLVYDFVYGEKKEEEEKEAPAETVTEDAEEAPVEATEVVQASEEVAQVTEEPVEATEAVPVEVEEVVQVTEEPVQVTEEPVQASEDPVQEVETVKEVETAKDGEEPAQEVETTSEVADASATGPAYNPETGEINWDCPCLGGMAHGPCGEEFKDAFSCFIYSEADPKGVDCIEKFQGMQECFKKHPDVYADQLKEDGPAVETAVVETVATEEPVEATETLTSEKPAEIVEEVLIGGMPAAVVEEIVAEDVVPVVEHVVVEEIVPVVDEVISEEIVPVVHEVVTGEIVPVAPEVATEELVPVVEEKIVPAAQETVAEPESIEELVEEGLPINADD